MEEPKSETLITAPAPAPAVPDQPAPSPEAGREPLRRRLPDERKAVVHHFSVGGHEGYVIVGLYENGQPGEISTSKKGSAFPKENLRGKNRLLLLWHIQEGKCPNCRERISKVTSWNLHHVLPKAHGGTDALSNLMLLHPNCHRQVHSRGIGALLAPVQRGFAKA